MLAKIHNVHGVLFDLDGTLLDTAADLTGAMNMLLREQNQQPIPTNFLKPYISLGTHAMLRAALHVTALDDIFFDLTEKYLTYYAAISGTNTTVYNGVNQVIKTLNTRKIPWGIVTNKISVFAVPLVAKFTILQQSRCLVTGDSMALCKPHPEPILYACQQLEVDPQRTLFIGDSEVDMLAGYAAQTMTVLAAYGYTPTDIPTTWPCNAIIHSMQELINFL